MHNLRLAGPSANPLMTADEYERNRRTESNALRASVERHYPAWTDAHIPRTEKPVRFRRVAIRKRDAWGMGWDHFSKSETFRYGY